MCQFGVCHNQLLKSYVIISTCNNNDPEETEQMMRQRRKNTFPKTVPTDIINGHGGRSAFIRSIRDDVFN